MLRRPPERREAFEKNLFAHQPVFGILLQGAMTAPAEIAALAGFDFAWIDMEHSTLSFREVEQLIIALENYGCVPLVRVRENQLNCIGQVLDMGARIVNVPHVDTVEDAMRAVRGAKYHPLGRRGYASCTRNTGHGMERLNRGVMEDRNEQTSLMVQIESEEAVRNAKAIAAVEGVDILFVGCGDLCQDMGLSLDYQQPRVREAVAAVGQAVRAAGKIGGIALSDPAQVSAHCAMGFNLICCGLDTQIFRMAAEALRARFTEREK